MKRIAPRVLGVVSAALLACTVVPAPAHAGDGSTAAKPADAASSAHRKVGRSGIVYQWAGDC